MDVPTPDQVQEIVGAAITDLAGRYGLQCPPLLPQTRPFKDVPGLDSLHCVELIVDISVQLPIETENDVFWDDAGRPRTLREVAECLHSRLGRGSRS